MSNRNALKVYDFTLTAGGSQVILVESAYFRIMTATGPVDVIGDTFGTLPAVEAGQGLQNTPYKRLTLRDASGAPNSGTILCSGDLFIDNRTIGNVAITNKDATSGAMTQASANVTNASGQLLAAKATRRLLLVQNNHATANIYLNLEGAAATIAAGVKLGPGGSLLLDNYVTSAAIFAIGDIASNTAVTVVEG
jgi:hypothetical protein